MNTNNHGRSFGQQVYQDEEDVDEYLDNEPYEEYGEGYVRYDDGSLVPVNSVPMNHPGNLNHQEHDEQYSDPHTHDVQPSIPQNRVFAIRGSQMYRVNKVNPSAPGPSQQVFKYVDSGTTRTIGGSSMAIPAKPIYHVIDHTNASRPFGSFNAGYQQPKREFGGSFTDSTSHERPKSKRKTLVGQRKPCNCTKSMCLKMYCDCFANGDFCRDCNCKDCHNNLEHDGDRTRAIKQSLDRNPNAFKPKIGVATTGQTDIERLHQKGCHCKKSGCLKNYCECYEAKVPCTDRCKCKGCQNTEHDRASRYKDNSRITNSALMNLANAATAVLPSTSNSRAATPISDDESEPEPEEEEVDPRSRPWFYMTDEVIEAASLCMVAQAEEALSSGAPEDQCVEQMERLVLREFGRCLEQIISSSSLPAA